MKKKINRRDFLKVMGVVGMTASLAAWGLRFQQRGCQFYRWRR